MLHLVAEVQQMCTCELVSFIIDNPYLKMWGGEKTFHSHPRHSLFLYLKFFAFKFSLQIRNVQTSGVFLKSAVRRKTNKCFHPDSCVFVFWQVSRNITLMHLGDDIR